jgi:hypothetical protein
LQTPNDVMHVPDVKKRSPQSRSPAHERAVQALPVGPRTRLKPEGQGVEAQRASSQRALDTNVRSTLIVNASAILEDAHSSDIEALVMVNPARVAWHGGHCGGKA